MTFSGSVLVFTSDRPLAQAHEDTSHMKANTAVTTKSWESAAQHIYFYQQILTHCKSFIHWLGVCKVKKKKRIKGKQAHNLGPLVVFAVLLQDETVYREGRHGVEEGKDSDGDKELSWRRVVSNQEHTFPVPSLTGGGIIVYLMKPEDGKQDGDTRKRKISWGWVYVKHGAVSFISKEQTLNACMCVIKSR